MQAHLKLISFSSESILSVQDAKDHLRIVREDDSENDQILGYINAAISTAEDFTERKIFDSVYDLRIPAQLNTFSLPYPGFKRLVSVKSLDENNQETELNNDAISVDDWADPAVITVNEYPIGSVYLVIRMEMGLNIMPPSLLQGIKMVLAHYYDNRHEVEVGRTANQVPMGAKSLFHMNRFQRF